MTIGIPRALIHWKNPNFWEVFFHSLGFKTLFSPLTNKEIVEVGTRVADPETCFSTKVYWGHLIWLDKKCDLIFVPRLKTNEEKLEYCPKLFGLPDLAKLLVKTPILVETFDERKRKFQKSLEKLAKKLGKNKKETNIAAKNAFLKEKEIKEKDRESFFQKIISKKPKIVLISHPYNLYDSYVNLRTKEKLEKLGVQPILIDEVFITKDPKFISAQRSGPQEDKAQFLQMATIDFHWEFAKEIFEKIQEIFKYNIIGGIEISSFQCGCDVVIKEFIEKEFKTRKIPFLYIIIDEHTGEAGLQTRLEAFIDTLS